MFSIGWRIARRDIRRRIAAVCLVSLVTAISVGVLCVGWFASDSSISVNGVATHHLSTPTTGAVAIDRARSSISEYFPESRSWTISSPLRQPGDSSGVTISDRPLSSVFGGRPFRVLAGELPTRSGELAITPQAAKLYWTEPPERVVGRRVRVGAHRFEVVAIVRNPQNFSEYGHYVAHGSVPEPAAVEAVIVASPGSLDGYIRRHRNVGFVALDKSTVTGDLDSLTIASLLFLLGAMIAVAGIGGVVAVSRLRRSAALLSTAGATPRQIQLAMVVVVSAPPVVGALAGVVVAAVALASLHSSIDVLLSREVAKSLNVFAVSGVAVGAVAVLAAVLTAWVPISISARQEALETLRITMPSRRSTMRPAYLVGLIAGVCTLLLAAFGVRNESVEAIQLALVCGWFVAIAAPVSFTTVVAKSIEGRRRVLGFVGREARSGSTRVSNLAMGMTIVVSVFASAILIEASNAKQHRIDSLNLPANMLLIEDSNTGSLGRVPEQLDKSAAAPLLSVIGSALPSSKTVLVRVPVDPSQSANSDEFGRDHPVRFSVLAEQNQSLGFNTNKLWPTWIARPDLLKAVGVEPASSKGATAFAYSASRTKVRLLAFEGMPGEFGRPTVVPLPAGASIPRVWVAPSQIRARRWASADCCWLVVNTTAVGEPQIDQISASAGSRWNVVSRRTEPPPANFGLVLVGAALLSAAVFCSTFILLTQAESIRQRAVLNSVGIEPSAIGRIEALRTVIAAVIAIIAGIGFSYFAWWCAALTSDTELPFVTPSALIVLAVLVPITAALVSSLAGLASARRTDVRSIPAYSFG